nr:hypothetical protein [Tanacetum cinerariifolium]GEW82550.1 hypothetical protein [Tanacetum cinerariifolium]
MASFDYRLNPLYPIKECSSYGALYTTDYCCSDGSLKDKIICNLNKTPDLFQRPPQNCPKCGTLVDGQYCQGCALLRKKFKKDLFTYCTENGIFQDFQYTSGPSNDNTNVVNALQEPFVVKQDPGAHYGYNCPPKVLIIPNLESFNNQTVDELPQTWPSFDPTWYSGDGSPFTCDSTPIIVDYSPNVFNPPPQPPKYSYEFCGNDAYYGYDYPPQVPFTYDLEPSKEGGRKKQIAEEQAAKAQYWKIPICYDDEDYTIATTPKEPDNSLSIRDEHLDTILATESDEFIKSSIENLVPNPSESEGEHKGDVPACDDFTTFYNLLFDVDDDFSSSDDESFSDEDILRKIYSNPLLILFLMISPVNSLFSNQTNCDPEDEIRLIKKLLYDNSSLRPPKEFISENSDAAIKSFCPSPLPVEDSDSFMEEIVLSFTPDEPMPPSIEEDVYDSERDIHILEKVLSNDSLLLPENKSFHFDISSSS